jgi:hypothetical protein
MRLRRFNENGTEQFREYLARLRDDPKILPPPELTDDPRFTAPVEPHVEVERVSFATKFDAAEYLSRILSPIPGRQLRIDTGLWSWLSIWFFDQLCPLNANVGRKAKDTVRYVARPNDHRFGLDKHLLFFPWKMLTLHGEHARFLLSQPLEKDSREQREWTGYNHNLSTSLVVLCRRLYWNESEAAFKRGARGKGPGSLRRLMRVAKQLEVTYDIHGLAADRLAQLLPLPEFERWIPRQDPAGAGSGAERVNAPEL